MNLPDWLQDEVTRRAEEDRLARKSAYDRWAKAYGAPMVTVRVIELTRSPLHLLRKEPVR